MPSYDDSPSGFAVIRETQGGMVEYTRTRVLNVRRGRVYVEYKPAWGGRGFYLKTGKNCLQPTGQTRLVLPLTDDEHMERMAALTEQRDYYRDGGLKAEIRGLRVAISGRL